MTKRGSIILIYKKPKENTLSFSRDKVTVHPDVV